MRHSPITPTLPQQPEQRMSEMPGIGNAPEKEGWLKKMGNNMAKDWKKRYVAIKGTRIFYYRNYEVKKKFFLFVCFFFLSFAIFIFTI